MDNLGSVSCRPYTAVTDCAEDLLAPASLACIHNFTLSPSRKKCSREGEGTVVCTDWQPILPANLHSPPTHILFLRLWLSAAISFHCSFCHCWTNANIIAYIAICPRTLWVFSTLKSAKFIKDKTQDSTILAHGTTGQSVEAIGQQLQHTMFNQ